MHISCFCAFKTVCKDCLQLLFCVLFETIFWPQPSHSAISIKKSKPIAAHRKPVSWHEYLRVLYPLHLEIQYPEQNYKDIGYRKANVVTEWTQSCHFLHFPQAFRQDTKQRKHLRQLSLFIYLFWGQVKTVNYLFVVLGFFVCFAENNCFDIYSSSPATEEHFRNRSEVRMASKVWTALAWTTLLCVMFLPIGNMTLSEIKFCCLHGIPSTTCTWFNMCNYSASWGNWIILVIRNLQCDDWFEPTTWDLFSVKLHSENSTQRSVLFSLCLACTILSAEEWRTKQNLTLLEVTVENSLVKVKKQLLRRQMQA